MKNTRLVEKHIDSISDYHQMIINITESLEVEINKLNAQLAEAEEVMKPLIKSSIWSEPFKRYFEKYSKEKE